MSEHLRDIVSRATPGPWIHRQPPDDGTIHEVKQQWHVIGSHPLLLRMADTGYTPESSWDRRAADATFIATFDPVLVAALLDVVDAARADVKALGTDTRIDCECPLCATATALSRLDALTSEKEQTDE
jgi:hypothetical protein